MPVVSTVVPAVPNELAVASNRIGASAGAGWRHEAQMLAKCADHPNIVTLHEVMEDAHYVYIFMEECEGARAENRVHKKQRDACAGAVACMVAASVCAWKG